MVNKETGGMKCGVCGKCWKCKRLIRKMGAFTGRADAALKEWIRKTGRDKL